MGTLPGFHCSQLTAVIAYYFRSKLLAQNQLLRMLNILALAGTIVKPFVLAAISQFVYDTATHLFPLIGMISMTREYRPVLFFALLLFIIAFVPRFLIVLTPIVTQLKRTLPDNSYYYFLTARNILEGKGSSVDGIHSSNGWHPLWLLVNLTVYALPIDNPDTLVRINLSLGTLFDSLVVIILFLGLRRTVSLQAGVAGSLFYAVNAMPLLQSVNGLETGLSSLLVALAWFMTVILVQTGTSSSGDPVGRCFRSLFFGAHGYGSDSQSGWAFLFWSNYLLSSAGN